jgi:hypothetical protein
MATTAVALILFTDGSACGEPAPVAIYWYTSPSTIVYAAVVAVI